MLAFCLLSFVWTLADSLALYVYILGLMLLGHVMPSLIIFIIQEWENDQRHGTYCNLHIRYDVSVLCSNAHGWCMGPSILCLSQCVY